MKYTYNQYADDVISGKQVACKWVKLAIKRDIYDQETGHLRGIWFDDEAAEKIIDFFDFCKHSKGKWAGTVIHLEPWQQWILSRIFGWKKQNAEGETIRRFKTAYEEIGRKNAKSTIASGIGNYLTGFDGEAGSECYCVATKSDQAKIVHGVASSMVKASPDLQRVLDTRRFNIHSLASGSKFEPLGKDSKTSDGLNVHGCIVDEYHAHPTADMYDVIRSGMGSRQQPLMFVITTAGFEKVCPCYTMHEDICNILDNYDDDTINDDTVFGIIFTIDDDDDWMDESCWIKANPNLGISVDLEDMRDMLKTAIRVPSKQNEFKTKKLNIWTEAVSLWISSEAWKGCNYPVDESKLIGRTCYGGIDLSTVSDITAWVLCFPPRIEDEKFEFLFRFFIPGDELYERVRNDKVPYDVWIEKGFVCATPGPSIDYNFVLDKIRNDSEIYDIKQIAYDPHNASHIVQILENENFTMVKFGQGMMSMSPPSKDFEKRVLDGGIAHNNNPVMKWMVGCTTIYQDSNSNIKPVKPDRGKTSKRIDGVIATIEALDAAIRNQKKRSVYETRGILNI